MNKTPATATATANTRPSSSERRVDYEKNISSSSSSSSSNTNNGMSYGTVPQRRQPLDEDLPIDVTKERHMTLPKQKTFWETSIHYFPLCWPGFVASMAKVTPQVAPARPPVQKVVIPNIDNIIHTTTETIAAASDTYPQSIDLLYAMTTSSSVPMAAARTNIANTPLAPNNETSSEQSSHNMASYPNNTNTKLERDPSKWMEQHMNLPKHKNFWETMNSLTQLPLPLKKTTSMTKTMNTSTISSGCLLSNLLVMRSSSSFPTTMSLWQHHHPSSSTTSPLIKLKGELYPQFRLENSMMFQNMYTINTTPRRTS